MLMKRSFLFIASLVFLLTACAPNFQKEEEVKSETGDNETETAILPKFKISDEYYSMSLPFKTSEARGLVVNNLNSRYDISEFESGLMRVAQNTFSTENYYFQEGQYLNSSTVASWLNRKYTAKELKDKKMSESDNVGLNPSDEDKSQAESGEMDPIYLAHILEHDYLVKNEETNKLELGGVTIGLALNSVYYYQEKNNGSTKKKDISQQTLQREGKKIAAEVIKRLRKIEGLENVPINIALFEQKETSSVVPGNFIAYANAGSGESSLGEWKSINEKYVIYPNNDSQYKTENAAFSKFQNDIEEYFPNFNGVIGKGFYINNKLRSLSIEMKIQFYGATEVIGFSQYVAGKVMDRFKDTNQAVQVSITSANGEEALIVRDAGQDEPFVHIYQ